MEYKLDADAVLIAVTAEPNSDVTPPLAMAYVPMQQWDCVYEDVQGLQRGTIFPGLDKPFLGGACAYV